MGRGIVGRVLGGDRLCSKTGLHTGSSSALYPCISLVA